MIRLVLTLVLACCVTLGTILEPRAQQIHAQSNGSAGFLASMLGESRRLFANQFFVEADVYFHSGYYPGIFDKQEDEANLDVNSKEEATSDQSIPKSGRRHVAEEGGGFLGKPHDFLEAFGRNFIPTEHTHLAGRKVGEILPWLRLSATLDPHRIQTYLTASYWLRGTLNEPSEAEQFLREGLRANPDSFEILIELGYVYDLNYKNPRVAHNQFELALQDWTKQEKAGLEPSPKAQIEILDGLVRADEHASDLKTLLVDLEALKLVSPNKTGIEETIAETKAKLAGQKP
jgi:hypothetical protein